jgi:hypothetical protein
MALLPNLPGIVANFGVEIGGGYELVHFGSWGNAAVGNILLQERIAGSFANAVGAGTTFNVNLEAPYGFRWASDGASVTSPNGSRLSPSVTQSRGEFDGRANALMTLTINPGTLAPIVGAVIPGQLRIEGLQLEPLFGIAQPIQEVPIAVRVGPGIGQTSGGTHDRWNRTGFVVANRGLPGLRMPALAAADIPMIDSGQVGATVWNSGIIRILSDAPGSFIENPTVAIDLNQEGVQIRGIRWRAYDATRTDITATTPGWNTSPSIPDDELSVQNAAFHVTDKLVRFTANDVQHATRNRVLEIQLQLRAAPGFALTYEMDTIEVNVTMPGHFDFINDSIVVATVRDPITLSVDEEVAVVPRGDVLGFIAPSDLPDVTITEVAAGRLAVGDWIYVYVVPTFSTAARNVFPNIAIGDISFSTSLTPETTGNLRLDSGQRVAISTINSLANTTNFPNVPVYRFRVVRASTAPGATITFTHNMLAGSVWNVPGVEFSFVVAGNSIAGNVLPGTGTSRLAVAPMPYSIVVGTVEGQVPGLGDGGTVTTPGTPGDTTPPPADTEPLFVIRDTDIVQGTVGTNPAVINVNGMNYISIRAFANALEVPMDLIVSTRDTEGRRVVSITARHADDRVVTMQATVGLAGVVLTIAPYNLSSLPAVLEHGAVYLPIGIFGQVFGYNMEAANGTFSFSK